MAIYQHGSKFRLDFTIKGQRIVKSFGTREEAAAWQMRAKTRVSLGLPADEESAGLKIMTVEECLKTASNVWMRQKSATGSISNGTDVARRLGFKRDIKSITRADVDSLVATYVAEGLAPSTVNRKLSALSSLLKAAKDSGVPITLQVRALDEAEGRVRYLSLTEESAALDYFEQQGDQDMVDFVAVAIDTGGRLSELLAMQPAWVRTARPGKWTLTFPGRRTKSSKTRTIPLTERAAAILVRRLETDMYAVWPSAWTVDRIGYKWAKMRQALGLKDDDEFVFHACRHTCAVRLLEATGNIVLIRDWLGHADIKTSTIYAKVVAGALEAGASALDDLRKLSA